jgi:L-alanine-DL-glutamate epimerase-like enolase superfamily enzyme
VNIVRAELAMLRIPLRTTFRTALRTVERAEDVVLRLHTDDGRVGHGSAPATPQITGDTHASIIAALREAILPPLLAGKTRELSALLAQVQGAPNGNVSARCAAEVALYDLAAQGAGLPLFRYLGGSVSTLETDLTISLDAIPKMLADVADALARGFGVLKIKLGNDVDEDIARVRAVHGLVAGRARLRLDANQHWSVADAIRVMGTLEADGIEADMLEQPVLAADLDGMAQVSAAIRTPVMADESVFGAPHVADLALRRAARIVNIKLIKAGGVAPALAIADISRAHALECMMGCMLESPIGVAAAAHVAAARADVIRHIDLDGPSLCTFDPVGSNVEFDGSHIRLGESPGLGITEIQGLEPIDA